VLTLVCASIQDRHMELVETGAILDDRVAMSQFNDRISISVCIDRSPICRTEVFEPPRDSA
jgi:hypothetical protein